MQRVSVQELRRIYNEETGYQALIAAGELVESVETDKPPARANNQPPGTRSQILAYTDSNGDTVLRLHRYLRPNGSLGASGRPDPKYILYNGVIYKEAAHQMTPAP